MIKPLQMHPGINLHESPLVMDINLHELFYPFQPTVASRIETSHLICIGNQMNGSIVAFRIETVI